MFAYACCWECSWGWWSALVLPLLSVRFLSINKEGFFIYSYFFYLESFFFGDGSFHSFSASCWCSIFLNYFFVGGRYSSCSAFSSSFSSFKFLCGLTSCCGLLTGMLLAYIFLGSGGDAALFKCFAPLYTAATGRSFAMGTDYFLCLSIFF